jgi:nicotinamide-nucleotide amidase
MPFTSSADKPMSGLPDLARRALELAEQKKLSIVTAESCTAGKLSALLSESPGAAECLHGSFVTYTKANKTCALGVPASLLAEKGAVCRDVAVAMAEGALARSPAQIAVSITGVAGPDGDEDGNPVGRVCIALACAGRTREFEHDYGNPGREAVQERAMADALHLLIAAIEAS